MLELLIQSLTLDEGNILFAEMVLIFFCLLFCDLLLCANLMGDLYFKNRPGGWVVGLCMCVFFAILVLLVSVKLFYILNLGHV